MKTSRILAVILVISLMFLFGAERGTAQEAGPSNPEAALGTGFTYQGQISKDGSPITGTCDLQFSLWNALSSGTEVGTPSTVTGVSVVQRFLQHAGEQQRRVWRQRLQRRSALAADCG